MLSSLCAMSEICWVPSLTLTYTLTYKHWCPHTRQNVEHTCILIAFATRRSTDISEQAATMSEVSKAG